jgi:hypothetical protein
MAADIYTMFRQFIGDTTTDYDMPDLESLAFLDLGIDKASEVLNNIVIEDIVISASDITAGYKELSYDIVTIIDSEFPMDYENIYWVTDGGKKIVFLDTDFVKAGTYEFRYKARYNKFNGVVKSNGDLNHPTNANLGIVFWALAEYQVVKGIINADNSANLVTSKSEEGMSVSYGTGTALRLSSPTELKLRAMEIFNMVSNKSNISFSVSV